MLLGQVRTHDTHRIWMAVFPILRRGWIWSSGSSWRRWGDAGRDVVETPDRHSVVSNHGPEETFPPSWGGVRKEARGGWWWGGGGADVRQQQRDGDTYWFCFVFHSLQRLFKHIDSDVEPRDVCGVSGKRPSTRDRKIEVKATLLQQNGVLLNPLQLPHLSHCP